jgi:plastocyanin
MKIANSLVFSRLLIILFFFVIAKDAVATTHQISFQNFFYTPSELNVQVGDTIEWMGTFSSHPLQDSVIPAGAEHFGPITLGATFKYAVTAPGVYWYHCNNHFAFGMHGTFIASGSADVKQKNEAVISIQNFPNPFDKTTTINYSLINPAEVELKIFDLNGKQVHHSSYGHQVAGSHEFEFSASAFPAGTYYYQIQAGDVVLTREMIVLH